MNDEKKIFHTFFLALWRKTLPEVDLLWFNESCFWLFLCIWGDKAPLKSESLTVSALPKTKTTLLKLFCESTANILVFTSSLHGNSHPNNANKGVDDELEGCPGLQNEPLDKNTVGTSGQVASEHDTDTSQCLFCSSTTGPSWAWDLKATMTSMKTMTHTIPIAVRTVFFFCFQRMILTRLLLNHRHPWKSLYNVPFILVFLVIQAWLKQ